MHEIFAFPWTRFSSSTETIKGDSVAKSKDSHVNCFGETISQISWVFDVTCKKIIVGLKISQRSLAIAELQNSLASQLFIFISSNNSNA